mgnify:CR=1 FL=1
MPKIKYDVEIDDNGNMKKMGADATRAGKAMDGLAGGSRNAERNIKGVAQTSSNATKNFSKMAQGTGGLVGAYATLAANIFAVSAAFAFLEDAANLASLQAGQDAFLKQTGRSMTLLTAQMQDATNGMLKFRDASQAAAIGQAAGLTNSQLIKLSKLAKNASLTLGRDLTDSFNRLVRGVIKAEPELLDELGIIIRLDRVMDDYAASINTSAKALSQLQRSQAVVNAVLDQGNTKFSDLTNEVNQVTRVAQAFNTMIKDIKLTLEPFVSFLAETFANNIEALSAAFGLLALSITKSFLPALPSLGKVNKFADQARERLVAAAGTSKTGDRMRKGIFDDAVLNQVSRSASKASKSVIDSSQLSKKAILHDIRVIRAEQQLMHAENTRGIKRFGAVASAQYKLLIAEFGVAVGTMVAMWRAAMFAMNAALGILGILGLITTLGFVLKEFIQTLKDPAVVAILNATKDLKRNTALQVAELTKANNLYEKSGRAAEDLVKAQNMLTSFSYTEGTTQLLEQLGTFEDMNKKADELAEKSVNIFRKALGFFLPKFVYDETADQANKNRLSALLDASEASATSMTTQVDLLKTNLKSLEVVFGKDSDEVKKFSDRIKQADQDVKNFSKIDFNSVYRQTLGAGDMRRPIEERRESALRATFEQLQGALKNINLDTIITDMRELAGQESDAVLALKALSSQAEKLDKFKQSVIGIKTEFTTFLETLHSTETGLVNILESLGTDIDTGVFSDEQKRRLEEIFEVVGITLDLDKENVRVSKMLNELSATRRNFKSIEKQDALLALAAQKDVFELEKEQGQFAQISTANEKKKINIIKDLILKRNQILKLEKIGGVDSGIKLRKLKKEEEFLEAQLAHTRSLLELDKARIGILLERRKLARTGMIDNVDKTTLDLEKKRATIQKNTEERRINAATRVFDKAKRNAEMLGASSEELLDLELSKVRVIEKIRQDQIKAEGVMREKIVKMEMRLLAAQLAKQRIDAQDQRKNRFDILQTSTDTNDLEQAARDIVTLDHVIAELTRAEGGILELTNDLLQNIKDATQDKIEDSKAAVDAANDASAAGKKGLEDINALRESIQGSLEGGLASLIDGTNSFKDAFHQTAQAILQDISRLIARMIVMNYVMPGFNKGFNQAFDILGGAKGGIMEPPGYAKGGYSRTYNTGGIARGPKAGYPAMLHGTEAVVPLPNNRHIPVTFTGGNKNSSTNNVTVNVSTEGGQNTQVQGDAGGAALGNAIARAVQEELQAQKRSGGILSPYGAS